MCESLYGHVQNVMDQRDDMTHTMLEYSLYNSHDDCRYDEITSTEKRRNSSANHRRGSQNITVRENNMQNEKVCPDFQKRF